MQKHHPILNSSVFLFWVGFLFFIHSSTALDTRYGTEKFEACKRLLKCGRSLVLTYPFWGGNRSRDCGHPSFQIYCIGNNTTMKIKSKEYNVLYVNEERHALTVVQMDTKDDGCPEDLFNITLDTGLLNYSPGFRNLYFLYNCSPSSEIPHNSTCPKGFFVNEFARTGDSQACSNLLWFPVPTNLSNLDPKEAETNPKEAVKKGFNLEYEANWRSCLSCVTIGGQCGHDWSQNKFICYLPQQGGDKRKLGLGLGLGLGAPFVIAVLLYIVHYKKRWSFSSLLSGNSSSSDPSLNADLEEGSVYFGVPVFSYNELEEATSKFHTDKELGDGGFGTVYYGKLKDGREVAVKRLYEHNFKRVEQFMNEVEILTRLRHKNLVLLYGCTSRRSRDLLLVYEYIPNGTLADHLHGDRAKSSPLSWPVRMSIAIDTASALAYLHASEIIHRDVKTTNILLDNNFCVKVADFGLSRLIPTDVTHVSTAPQGTPGYVDPEYHQCYQLTDKSDVYSFGVVLMELVSSMPAVDITRDRSEINLSNLAINKIQKNAFDELIDQNLGYNTDEEVKRMTTSVAELGFRCLQQDKEMRPDMEEVLKELEKIQKGNAEEKQEEVQKNDSKESLNPCAPPSPQDCDEAALLRNVGMTPPSPDSVTEQRLSCSSYASNLRVRKNGSNESMNPPAPPSPQDCDEDALLKNVGMTLPSPDSVTEQWHSCSSYASNLSG